MVFADGPAGGGPGGIPGPRKEIKAAVGPAGGFFGSYVEQTIASGGGEVGPPVIDVGADGSAVVAWQEFTVVGGNVIKVARRPSGATSFSTAVPVGSGTNPVVAAGANGAVDVAWRGVGDAIFAAVASSPTAPFVSLPQISENGPASAPVIASDPAGGRVLLAWIETEGGVKQVQTATGSAGGSLPLAGAPVDAPDGISDLRVATAGGGEFLLWRGDDAQIRFAPRVVEDGPDFDDPLALSPAPGTSSAPDIAAAGDGTVAATWIDDPGPSDPAVVQTRIRPPGDDRFGPIVEVSGLDSASPDIDAAPDGSLALAWRESLGGGQFQGRAAVTANVPTLSVPVVLGTPAVGATLTCGTGTTVGVGDTVITWVRDDGVTTTGAARLVTAADAGHALACVVAVSNVFGSVTSASTPVLIPAPPAVVQTVTVTTPAPPAPPAQTVTVTTPAPPVAAAAAGAPALRALPRITGRAKVGATLRCTPARFTGATGVSTAWLRGKTAIRGATKTRYKLRRGDRGKIVACRTTATGPGGTTTALSLGVLVKR